MTFLSLFITFDLSSRNWAAAGGHPGTVTYAPMDESPAPDLRLIPYAQALPAQLTQALVTAREALVHYYPAVAWSRWHQAFEDIQPTLVIGTGTVNVTPEGLTDLANYFDGQHPVSAPAPQSPKASVQTVKMTYAIRSDVLESLNRVSFWRRKGKSALVNLALKKLLSTYPESQNPLPPQEA